MTSESLPASILQIVNLFSSQVETKSLLCNIYVILVTADRVTVTRAYNLSRFCVLTKYTLPFDIPNNKYSYASSEAVSFLTIILARYFFASIVNISAKAFKCICSLKTSASNGGTQSYFRSALITVMHLID
jgi:hypothetical protein